MSSTRRSAVQNSSNPDSPGLATWLGALLLLLSTPLFLRMPLTNDTLLYDLQTRLFTEGAVPYRDVLEPNWPGVFWIQSAIRGIFGRSSEAMRAFDLACILATCGMSRLLANKAGATIRGANWLGLAFLAFYLGCSEWCHCQRDVWLLFPITLATWLRLFRFGRALSPFGYCALAICDGAIWGAAIWLKPYAGLVALAVGFTTLPLVPRGRLAIEIVGTLTGGATALLAGMAWLANTGALAPWLETMQVWNPRYLAAGRVNWTWPRFRVMALRMQPWYGLHLVAVPLAVLSVTKLFRRWVALRSELWSNRGVLVTTASLSAIYLATMLHVFLLQHLFDYVHAPAVLLAIVVVGVWLAQPDRSANWRLVAVAMGVLAAVQSPLSKPERVRLWWACVTQPTNSKLQDKLALLANPRRVHIERVAQFLREQHPGQGDILAYNSDLIGLYEQLQQRPPTRFVYLFELLAYFPNQRDELMAAVEKSEHRFVVSDLASCGMSFSEALEIGPDGPNAPPPKYRASSRPSYPWSQRVVFRSGPYLVHKVSGPLGKPGPLPRLSTSMSATTLARQ